MSTFFSGVWGVTRLGLAIGATGVMWGVAVGIGLAMASRVISTKTTVETKAVPAEGIPVGQAA